MVTHDPAAAACADRVILLADGRVAVATFAFVVEQRSRELALLRLTGATPWQVRAMVLSEAVCIGTAGAAAVAFRASRIRPASALREAEASTRGMSVLRVALGAGFLAAAVITGYVILKQSPRYVVNPGKYVAVPLCYVLGIALLAPAALRPAAALLPRGLIRQNTIWARSGHAAARPR